MKLLQGEGFNRTGNELYEEEEDALSDVTDTLPAARSTDIVTSSS